MKIGDLVAKFTTFLLTEKRVSENTFTAYTQDLNQFSLFCAKEELVEAEKIERFHLNLFLQNLKKNGLSSRSMARKIASLKGLFSYGAQRYGMEDFAKELTIPKIKKSLPSYLSMQELEKLFHAAEQDQSSIGKRNKIMLYVLYVTGMRVSELIALNLAHVQRDSALIAIDGKRGKQRLVPIPDRMMQELYGYIDQIRPVLFGQRTIGSSTYLFPVLYGKKVKPLTRQAFWAIIKQLCKKAGIGLSISPHTLRHSFATHMLAKGANLRALQMLLGHEQLTTVQIYTHIDTQHLRKIYDKKHPRS